MNRPISSCVNNFHTMLAIASPLSRYTIRGTREQSVVKVRPAWNHSAFNFSSKLWLFIGTYTCFGSGSGSGSTTFSYVKETSSKYAPLVVKYFDAPRKSLGKFLCPFRRDYFGFNRLPFLMSTTNMNDIHTILIGANLFSFCRSKKRIRKEALPSSRNSSLDTVYSIPASTGIGSDW